MMSLTADDLRSYGKKRQEVHLPELGGSVYVRALTSREVQDIFDYEKKKGNAVAVSIRIGRLCLVDAEGEALFKTDDEFSELPASILQAVVSAAQKYNRLGDDDAEGDAGN